VNRTLNTLLAAVALSFAAGAARAESPTIAPEIDGFVAQKTRAEVRSELAQALREGRVARNDFDKQRLALEPIGLGKSRAQVVAETREAARLGLLGVGEYGAIPPTAEQLRLIALADERAMAVHLAAR
jgi:hypothetical protein